MRTFNTILLRALIIGIIVHLINAIFFYEPFIEGIVDFKAFLIALLYSVVLTFLFSIYFKFLNQKVKWFDYGIKGVVLGNLGSVIITIPALFLCRLAHLVFFEQKYTVTQFVNSEKAAYYALPLFINIVITLAFQLFGTYKALQEQKVTEQKIIAGTATAKFDALKNQLDPHFLFNSLNVLTSLIEEDTVAAQKFTTSLSKVYRYVLEQKNKDVVSLAEELRFAEIYMSLLQMRFENSVFLETPDEIHNPEAKIVPLSLQLLLENTVKHNVATEAKPLKIKIFEKEGFLYVTNNLQPKAIMKTESGVGLSNISQRYEMLTKRPFSVEKTTDEFIAKLPVLTKKITAVMQDTPIEEIGHNLNYDLAKEKVVKIRTFYASLILYCIAVPGFIILNLKTSPNYYWFYFPVFGWGFGLLVQGLHAFNNNLFLGREWQERKLKQFLEEETNNG